MNLNKIIEEWVGEEASKEVIDSYDEYNSRDEAIEKGEILGYNKVLKDLKSRIPELTDRIVEEIASKVWLESDNPIHNEVANKLLNYVLTNTNK